MPPGGGGGARDDDGMYVILQRLCARFPTAKAAIVHRLLSSLVSHAAAISGELVRCGCLTADEMLVAVVLPRLSMHTPVRQTHSCYYVYCLNLVGLDVGLYSKAGVLE